MSYPTIVEPAHTYVDFTSLDSNIQSRRQFGSHSRGAGCIGIQRDACSQSPFGDEVASPLSEDEEGVSNQDAGEYTKPQQTTGTSSRMSPLFSPQMAQTSSIWTSQCSSAANSNQHGQPSRSDSTHTFNPPFPYLSLTGQPYIASNSTYDSGILQNSTAVSWTCNVNGQHKPDFTFQAGPPMQSHSQSIYRQTPQQGDSTSNYHITGNSFAMSQASQYQSMQCNDVPFLNNEQGYEITQSVVPAMPNAFVRDMYDNLESVDDGSHDQSGSWQEPQAAQWLDQGAMAAYLAAKNQVTEQSHGTILW